MTNLGRQQESELMMIFLRMYGSPHKGMLLNNFSFDGSEDGGIVFIFVIVDGFLQVVLDLLGDHQSLQMSSINLSIINFEFCESIINF